MYAIRKYRQFLPIHPKDRVLRKETLCSHPNGRLRNNGLRSQSHLQDSLCIHSEPVQNLLPDCHFLRWSRFCLRLSVVRNMLSAEIERQVVCLWLLYFMTQINEKQYGILSDFFLIYLYYIIVEWKNRK